MLQWASDTNSPAPLNRLQGSKAVYMDSGQGTLSKYPLSENGGVILLYTKYNMCMNSC